ncbi:undecaprenyl-diphosphate phosphatase [Hippea jasoniae]|uniref:undecaprenyl-diphosphate phosphatase n=1 Tax=Hippea jasoniae TaxID=944479 RepID=UPI00054D898E|nr:undecaprenyl-diphosphate phosphatase [Hippea jasoniae]
MSVLDAIILGIVEGLTEFLPISSTGHLILASSLLGIKQTPFTKSFEIIIQLGAILSVLFLYFNRLKRDFELWKRIIWAFIPTGVVGFVLYKLIKQYLFNPHIVVYSLTIGGIIIIAVEFLFEKIKPQKQINQLNLKQSVIIGLFQSLAVVPGTSRSASSIIGAMAVGLTRKEAVEFSFLLAIPTMFAATGYDILKSGIAISSHQWHLIAIGFIVSFFSALVAVKGFIGFVSKYTLKSFGVYRIIIGIIFLFVLK